MKKFVSVLLLSLPMVAAASNCDEISAGIAERITNNGVQAPQFQLKLIPADQAQQQIEGKVVGSCDRGQQNIVYVRLDGVSTSSTADTPKTEPAVEQKVDAPTETQNAPASVENQEPQTEPDVQDPATN